MRVCIDPSTSINQIGSSFNTFDCVVCAMKKICIICPAVYPLLKESEEIQSAGGAEAQLKVLGLALADRGYEIHYIVDDFGQRDTEKINDVTVHKVALKYMGGPKYYFIPAWIKLWRTLFRIKADIHIIKIPRHILLLLGAFCKLYKKKIVFLSQTDRDVDPKLIKETENVLSYWFFRLGLTCIDYVVVQNRKQEKGFIEKYGKDAAIIRSIITLPEANPIHKQKYILWVGNNRPEKQPEKFLELARSLPEYKFVMIMSYISPRYEIPSIHNLQFLGFVPFVKIAKYFQQASLLVSTSVLEGFPNTFLQAWQYSTPVVSLHVDPDDVIKKNDLGRHSETFEKMKEDVKELMDNEVVRMKIGENAKRYVQAHHAPEVILPQYIKLFKQLYGDGG